MNPEELLLQELKSVMDNAGKDIEQEAISEHSKVLGLVSQAMDEHNEAGSHIYAIREVPIDEVLTKQSENPDRVLNHHGVTDPEAQGYSGGSIEYVGACDDAEGLGSGFSDKRLMTIIADQLDPVGLIGRACYPDGSRFTVMATPAFVSTERRSANGETLTRTYDPDKGNPDDLDTYKWHEVEAIRNVYGGLMLPRQLKREYPETFASLVKDIKTMLEKESDDTD
jgi:hypothetical protein